MNEEEKQERDLINQRKESRRHLVVGQRKTVQLLKGSSSVPSKKSQSSHFNFEDEDEENFFEELAQDFSRA
jgi:hypothetical protein